MIIDVILDRKGGCDYNINGSWCSLESLYKYTLGNAWFNDLGRAIDSGDEVDIKHELIMYIINNGYNTDIIKYILSVDWL